MTKYGTRNCLYCKMQFQATTKAHRYCSKAHANAVAQGCVYTKPAAPTVKTVEAANQKPKPIEYRLPGGMTDDELQAYRAQVAERVRCGMNRVHAYTVGKSWLV
jgi:hypothetical protein